MTTNPEHEKLIEEIEKKMMGDAIYKSEEEKKNELF